MGSEGVAWRVLAARPAAIVATNATQATALMALLALTIVFALRVTRGFGRPRRSRGYARRPGHDANRGTSGSTVRDSSTPDQTPTE